jgi:3-dehydroquinate synthase
MPPDTTQRCVRVNLGPRSYDARVGVGLLQHLGEFVRTACPAPGRAHLFFDEAIEPELVHAACASLASHGVRAFTRGLSLGEGDKTLDTLGGLLRELAEHRSERHEPLIALGGGLLGDAVGFAAAVHRRGVPWINCPTTLLAMVDAGIGGKTGVNLEVGPGPSRHLLKNMVGAFHQPAVVIADVAPLRTLPPRHLSGGLAECIKHAMIARSVLGEPGGDLTAWTTSALPAARRLDNATLIELIARHVALKARVVEADERETQTRDSGRILLNLGHTFGHAIETLDDCDLIHGEAVGLGLLAAANTALALGLCDATIPAMVQAALHDAGLPARVPLPDDGVILERMAHDKKSREGRLRLVLPTGPGRAAVVEGPSPEAVARGIASIRV